MRILLIGNFAPDRQESMLRFGRQLTDGLRAQGHEVATWSPEPRLVRLLPRYRYGGPAKFVGYVDKFLLFPRQVRARLLAGRPADVVHIVDHANAVYAPLFAGPPVMATCHDLLQIRAARGEFAQHRVSALGRRYQTWILRHIGRLTHVATPSHQTAVDLGRLTGMSSQRITVIPLGLNHPYQPQSVAAARLVLGCMLRDRGMPAGLLEHGGRGFLLNVGGGQWYKNRRGLLEIFAQVRPRIAPAPRLVMVGKPLAPDLVGRLRQLGLVDEVVSLSGVSAAELQALYSTAEGLLFPSWIEGFGWPVAEAQACGCPVFTSNRPPMTEVGGDAAVYLDPADPAGAARAIATAWPARREWRERGLLRAAEWAPERMIERYVATYRRLTPSQRAVA